MKRPILWFILGLLVVAGFVFRNRLEAAASMVKSRVEKPKTVSDRLAQYGLDARKRWKPFFEKQGVAYPPAHLVLVGLKHEKVLQVYAESKDQPPKLLRTMPILAASGKAGPKLREGDKQVPEGLYNIESLNPNSSFHLALRVGYPNAFDREHAAQDGRTKLGGDIMIHGNAVSVGCLAMGNEGAEDLFILAAETGIKNITVVLSPFDFRRKGLTEELPKDPRWVNDLYASIRERLQSLPPE